VSGRLSGRVALVAGASRGIGAAVARAYAAEGAHVYLVARTVGALEEIDDEIQKAGGTATIVPLDLTDGPGIDRIGQALFDRHGKLDILTVAAAQLGVLSPLGHIDPKMWERTFAINVGAPWRMVRSFDPLLRRSDAGRAVFVTTGLTRRVAPYWGVYAASKAALESLALTWAAEVAGANLRVNLINPGPTRTRLRAQAFPGENPQSLPAPEAHAEAFVRLALPACSLHGAWVAADEFLARGDGALQ
jgi:NAD(P)-dependent dehydrogenase (short-subunit alcohol dehydrogenase family)